MRELWPVCWLGYVLALGAGTSWYPYPFLDAQTIGYGTTAVHCLLVAVLLLVVAFAFSAVDRWLAGRTGERVPPPEWAVSE